MEEFFIGLTIGLFVGALVGCLAACMCVVAKDRAPEPQIPGTSEEDVAQ